MFVKYSLKVNFASEIYTRDYYFWAERKGFSVESAEEFFREKDWHYEEAVAQGRCPYVDVTYLDSIPSDEHDKMLKKYQDQYEHAKKMIDILTIKKACE